MNSWTIEANRVAAPRRRAPLAKLWWAIAFAVLPAIAGSDTLNLREVAPGIFVHQGREVGLESPQREDIANIGFIVGEKCVAVIDTGGSLKIGRELRSALRRISEKPICYVINTHVHFDHVLGNAAFLDDRAVFVGHRNLRAAIDNNRSFFLDSFARELAGARDPNRIKGPDLLVEQSKILDLGKRRIELTAHPTAHTDSDLSVFDLNTKTLWVADLLFVQHIPAINGSLNGWIQESEKLLSRDVRKMIPGHGPVPDDWHAPLKAQLRYLKKLRSEIRAIIRKGGFLEEALDAVGRSEKDRWLLFGEYHKRNITRAFAELEWE
ncbi:MAG: quinoprotein relay system zinc metallohydrolase 2 [Gammaproteobacteria bacterium]